MTRSLRLSVYGILFLLLAAGISWADGDAPVFSSSGSEGTLHGFSLPSSQDRWWITPRLFRQISSGHDVFPGRLHPT